MSDSKIARLAPSGNTEINAREILCERGGRRRTGSLTLRKRAGKMTWCAQVTVDADAGPKRVLYSLDTDDRTIAKRKLRKLVSRLDGEREVRRDDAKTTTLADYADHWIADRKAEGVVSARDEEQRLRDYILPELGAFDLGAVSTGLIQDAIDRAGERVSRATVIKIRGTVVRMLAEAKRSKLVSTNEAADTRVRRSKDEQPKKRRAILTDAELDAFLAYPLGSLELKLLAVAARTLGGMRTSDLGAWQWSNVDLEGFAWAIVPRPKTATEQRFALPEDVGAALRGWWREHGQPTTGPVFPVRRGPRAGERKQARGTSYAARLRRDLRRALDWQRAEEARERGIPLDAVPAPRAELFTDTDKTLRVDFHSFRRAFCTGLARAGVSMQQAQQLADHADARTHMVYVGRLDLELPEGVTPKLSQRTVALLSGPPRKSPRFRRDTQDSNLRPSASEADALSN
jgi:integrase